MSPDSLPIVSDADSYNVLAHYENKIILGRIPHLKREFPDYYHPGDYVLLFFKGGTLSGTVNMRPFEIKAPAVMFVSVEHILHLSDVSGDLSVDTLAFKHSVGEDLKIDIPMSLLQQIMVRPSALLSEQEILVVQDYFNLIASVIGWRTDADRYPAILYLLRSLTTMLCGVYQLDPVNTRLTRAEEIAGRFMVMAERFCRKHHDIGWYADELCLSPKYVANVVKEVTGNTAGDCINDNLVRQAKSLLLTTSLSIQQISDRLGFQNQSHFGTFFRRHTNTSPTSFRHIPTSEANGIRYNL